MDFVPDAQVPIMAEGEDELSERTFPEIREGRANGVIVSGGMIDCGAYEEDGSVTWEILASPR